MIQFERKGTCVATYISLILSAVLFVWELKGLGREYVPQHGNVDAYAVVLLYVRSIFIFVCIPFLWIAQLLKLFGLLPSNDMDSPNLLQMKMFAWTINFVLVVVFLWKAFL